MTATRVIDGILQLQPAPQDRWQNAPDKLQRAFMAASALTREEFNLVFLHFIHNGHHEAADYSD